MGWSRTASRWLDSRDWHLQSQLWGLSFIHYKSRLSVIESPTDLDKTFHSGEIAVRDEFKFCPPSHYYDYSAFIPWQSVKLDITSITSSILSAQLQNDRLSLNFRRKKLIFLNSRSRRSRQIVSYTFKLQLSEFPPSWIWTRQEFVEAVVFNSCLNLYSQSVLNRIDTIWTVLGLG